MIGEYGVVFIGNSSSKSYHTLIDKQEIANGDQTYWHGIYSWFSAPQSDTFRENALSPEFEYYASIKGVPTLMHLDAEGRMSNSTVEDISIDRVGPIAVGGHGRIEISSHVRGARCFSLSGTLIFRGRGSVTVSPGIYIVVDDRGNMMKVVVK